MNTLFNYHNSQINLPNLRAEFGAGRAKHIVPHAEEMGIQKPLIVGTSNARTRYASVLDPFADKQHATFFDAQPHCPQETVEVCRLTYQEQNCDGVVSIGGGSTLGLGKILSAEEGAKFIAIPTTYSGSEATAIFGRKTASEKRTKVDNKCRPDLIVYDPELSLNLPSGLSVMTGLNSMAHAVDALYANNAGPLTIALAREALTGHRNALKQIVQGNETIEARGALLYAGYLGGLLVSMHGIALHHRLCHVIGGMFDVPHGASNSIVLPHAVAYNRGVAPEADKLILEIFGGEDPAKSLYSFAQSLNAPSALVAFGVPIEAACEIAQQQVEHGGFNPRPMLLEPLTKMLSRLIAGEAPGTYN